MNAIEDWKAFAALFGPAQESASNGNWRLLFARRGRVLALPKTRAGNAAGLDYFVRGGRKRWWAELALAGCRLHDGLLPLTQLSIDQHEALNRVLFPTDGERPSQTGEIFAIQFGSRGPLQKVIVLGTRNESRIMAKVALKSGADERIREEAMWLGRLAQVPGLARHVPILIDSGTTPGGRSYFTMGALDGSLSRSAFAPDHAALLREISMVDRDVVAWQGSRLARTIAARLDTLETSGENNVHILRSGWNAVNRALADSSLPTCLSHGDFAEWNLLNTSAGLAAVDWEYAQSGWNPLADFFHFHLIPAALNGSLAQGRVDHASLLARGALHAHETFALNREAAIALTIPLMLTYLIDTVSFYALTSGRIDPQDRVVGAYLGHIAANS